ncbi:hypothetical protein FB451DRAFT_1180685 [Mycena latifolia]|nr:hypothetical protein FB451DRAFT_1180685 [Mycena latifolia]
MGWIQPEDTRARGLRAKDDGPTVRGALRTNLYALCSPPHSVNDHRGERPRAPHPARSAPSRSTRASRPGPCPTLPPSSSPCSPTSPPQFSQPQAPGPSAPLIAQPLSLHSPTLKTLVLVDCAPGTMETLPALCGSCARLEIAVPGTRLTRAQTLFGAALARSTALRNLVHLAPPTHIHAVRFALALALMASVPNLHTVVSGGRVWTRRTGTTASAGKAGISVQIFLVVERALHPRRILVGHGINSPR